VPQQLRSAAVGRGWVGPDSRLVSALRVPVLVGAGCLFAAEATRMTVRGSRLPLALLAALAIVLLALARPQVAVLGVIAVTCFVSDPNIGHAQVGGVTTDLGQALGYAVIGWALLATTTRTLPASLRAGRPLVLLVVAAAFGAVLGLSRGSSQFLVLGQFKEYLFYLLVLPLLMLFRTLRQREELQRWVLLVCTVGATWVCLSGLTGQRVPVFSPGAAIVETLGKTVDAQRIRPAMLPLLVVATLLLATQVASHGWTQLRAFQAAVFTAAWVLTLTRSFWLPLALALLLVPVLRAGRRIPLRGLRNGLVLLVIAGGGFAAASAGALGPTPAAAADRIYSIGSTKLAQDPSYTDRADEFHNAVQTLAQHPVTGVGLGQPYGAKRPVYDPRANVVRYEDRFFTHNSLLFAYLQGGILAVLALGWLVASAGVVALKVRGEEDEHGANLRLAGALSVLTLAAVALVNTHLIYRPNAVALCVAVVLMAPVARDA
jgi:O-antigen ligase